MRSRALLGSVVLVGVLLCPGCARVGSTVAPPPTSSRPSVSTPAPTWIGTEATVRSGLVRVDAVGCTSTLHGNGFVLPDAQGGATLILAPLRVVDGAQRVLVRTDTLVAVGEVVSRNPDTHLSLLRLTVPLKGAHAFTWADRKVTKGTEVGVLGARGAADLGLTRGRVTASDDDQLTARTDTQPDSLGSPVVSVDGRVVGVVLAPGRGREGTGALPGPLARAFVKDHADDEVIQPGSCSRSFPSLTYQDLRKTGTKAVALQVLERYAQAVNTGQDAQSLLTGRAGPNQVLKEVNQRTARNGLSGLQVVTVTFDDRTVDLAEAKLTTRGKGGCLDWRLRIRLTWGVTGSWQIDDVRSIGGSPTQCG